MAKSKPIPTLSAEQEARFWSKVSVPEQPSCCWEWTASTANGYGQLTLNNRTYRAHRVAYALLIGAFPLDLQFDHLCRNRLCVNPDHIRLVTVEENTRAGFGPSGLHARKTHCPKGHPYTPENTKTFRGRRQCRACMRDRQDANHPLQHGSNQWKATAKVQDSGGTEETWVIDDSGNWWPIVEVSA